MAEYVKSKPKSTGVHRPQVPDLRHLLAGPLGDIESPVEADWEAAR